MKMVLPFYDLFAPIEESRVLTNFNGNFSNITILAHELGQVIVDIYSRFIFEKNLFNKRKDSSFNVDELKDLMLDAQKKAYGDGLNHNYLAFFSSAFFSSFSVSTIKRIWLPFPTSSFSS